MESGSTRPASQSATTSGGLEQELRRCVAAMDARGIDIRVEARGVRRPPERVEQAALRVGQAAIDNAIRHSGGRNLTVMISEASDLLELCIIDDGCGIDDLAETDAQRQGHIGLAQMRLRAEAVGATLDFRSAPGSGTHVCFLWAG